MLLQQNIHLKPFNTFGIDEVAEYFATISDLDDLQDVADLPYKLQVLGGGSNILLTAPVQGVVAHNALKGHSVLREDAHNVWLQVQAGEVWHDLVLYATGMGWGGIENLALIPGTVGAAPIQNIGAYGAEVREVLEEVTFYHLQDKTFVTYGNADCRFGYRDSVFKHELRGRAFITSVVLRLSKQPVFNTSYGAIEQELAAMDVQTPTVQAIAQAVMNIRSSKLPDPRVTGNAGSFFKNPTVPRAQYEALLPAYPSMPHFVVSDSMVKIPAAWLIEQCGWKGHRRGDAGVHTRQALVLVNYGGAKGREVWELSGEIVASVAGKFGIELEREVQVW
ncbi:UDP-N-acetylmuramate dehydrogenase [Nemorincola caseinilytica]|uniref:UDP-N-acetylenolpyruvoylglucosamine reductase n=2 Tax=Nemorincola caseinilytica TaxID=2054315 RepID=A0ABP8N2T2_9BACT